MIKGSGGQGVTRGATDTGIASRINSSKRKEVDPRERGIEDFLTIFRSSSSDVCSSSFSCHYFSLSLPLFKARMSHEEPRTADKT